jgi:single-stranded-DNA-specific exonuclease
MHYRWFHLTPPSEKEIADTENDLKVSPLVARILLQRKLADRTLIGEFVTPSAERLHDPFLMKDMDRAVERLDKAISAGEKILVYGDYDVDGTAAVALVYGILSSYAEVACYIPDRYKEGYGFSFRGVEYAAENGFSLIIALDCGIKDGEKIAAAREKGIDVIVCDHHTPGETLPDCIVLDPKRDDCNYPFEELCGCGVGFKLLQGWFLRTAQDAEELYDQLDLVAVAIGADIVPVTGENRILCQLGLERLNKGPRPGISALLQLARRELPLDLSNVVFVIAPRINAAGRLESGMRAVDLLLAPDTVSAENIALEIDGHNASRRQLDEMITLEALELIQSDASHPKRKSTVVFHPEWHKGVVGIVASRLIEKHYRPTIVLTESKGMATGSARSVSNFNVYEAIGSCGHLLSQFGGHRHAAGLTLPVANVDAFRDAFDEYVSRNLETDGEAPELRIHHTIKLPHLFNQGESIHGIPRVLQVINKLEPFGPGNDKPVFCVESVYASSFRILKEVHLKVDLMCPESGIVLSAIGFNMADRADFVAAGCAFDCAFTLETNTWNGVTSLQLQIRDIRPAF